MDKFYTPRETVDQCMLVMRKYIRENDTVIEPSAGNGAFIESIKNLGVSEYSFLDIAPEHPEIERADFLSTQFPNECVFLGNPPFGRQSSIAKKFIKHACKFARLIGFILPKSFKKESMNKCFDPYFHCVEEIDISDRFEFHGETPHRVPCVFQVWEKREIERRMVEKSEPNGWRFVRKDEGPTFAFRRVGGTAGRVSKDIDDKSVQSHYFIVAPEHCFEELSKHVWTHENTVGPRSISKQELTDVLNDLIDTRIE